MTPPCVVPTFRPYTVENLEFGGFYASSCESRVNTEANSITPLTARTFGELGFKERGNLQEWIAKEPSCLGEELLVIPEGSLLGFPTLTNGSTCLPSTSKAPSFS
jgi:hypothetical protein